MRLLLMRVLTLTLFLAGLLASAARTHALEPDWARQFGTWASDSLGGMSRYSGDLYLVGRTTDAPNGASYYSDVFVRRHDATGALVWSRQFGTAVNDLAGGVTVDSTGVYVVGSTQGAFPGHTHAGGYDDVFVRRYSLDGQEQWTRQFGTGAWDHGAAIALDATGIYVTGSSMGAFPDSAGSGRAFVRKYARNGDVLWTRQYAAEEASAVAVGSSGVYLAGYGLYSVDEGGNLAWKDEAVLAAYDPNGEPLWVRTVRSGTSDNERASGVVAGSSGVYVSGYSYADDPRYYRSWVQKYDSLGTELWRHAADMNCSYGSSPIDCISSRDIALDSTGVYVVGAIGRAFPGYTNAGGSDVFVQKLAANGQLLWTRQLGTAGADEGKAITLDSTGVYLAGDTTGAFSGQTNKGYSDAYLAKFSHPAGADPALTVADGWLSADQGQTVTNTGTYSDADASDDITITASIGTVEKTGTNSGTWIWSYTQSPAWGGEVVITATDGRGGITTTRFYLATTYNLNAPQEADAGDRFSISVQSSASSSSLRYQFDCGSGYGAASTSSTAACTANRFPSQTVRAKVTDNGTLVSQHGRTLSVADTAPPGVSVPTHSLRTGSMLGASTIPVRISWSATDATSGVGGYQVQQRKYGSTSWGSWGWVTQGTTAKTLTRQLASGRYQFQVRAVDKAGNWSAWKAGTAFTVAPYQETSTVSAGKVAYSGTWSRQYQSSAYGTYTKYATIKGRYATFSFTGGKQVAWVAPKYNNRGYAYVYLDGVKVATVNLYSSSLQARRVVYAKTGLSPTVTHTLRVYVPGTKQAASSGTRVDVDAFVVVR